jgi:hypothetical protein
VRSGSACVREWEVERDSEEGVGFDGRWEATGEPVPRISVMHVGTVLRIGGETWAMHM